MITPLGQADQRKGKLARQASSFTTSLAPFAQEAAPVARQRSSVADPIAGRVSETHVLLLLAEHLLAGLARQVSVLPFGLVVDVPAAAPLAGCGLDLLAAGWASLGT